MSNAYTEDQLVEQPAIGLFRSLDWQVSASQSGMSEAQDAGWLWRETKGEMVIVPHLFAGAIMPSLRGL